MTTGHRTQIALLFYSTFNVIAFTAAVYATSLFPPLTPNAGFWLGAIMTVSLIVSAPIAWRLGALLPRELHGKLVARQSPLSHAPARDI